MHSIRDRYGRSFKTLRVSLLDRCNFGCPYCVSGTGDHSNASTKQGLPFDDLLGIIERLHQRLGLNKVRLTGGEPLLYKALPDLIRGIRLMNIPEIKLTTNGYLLNRLAAPLKAAGLDAINVSLDAIDEEVFLSMSGQRSVHRVIEGIDAALETGMPVKINTVLMKGFNEDQILPLMDFAHSRRIRIRFLEVMSLGHLYGRSADFLVSQEEALERISGRYPIYPLGRSQGSTARYWQAEGGPVFGMIANETEPFCGDCDRLRLDSQGNMYGCLSSNHPIPMSPGDNDQVWEEKLISALGQKQVFRFTGSDLSMIHIGG